MQSSLCGLYMYMYGCGCTYWVTLKVFSLRTLHVNNDRLSRFVRSCHDRLSRYGRSCHDILLCQGVRSYNDRLPRCLMTYCHVKVCQVIYSQGMLGHLMTVRSGHVMRDCQDCEVTLCQDIYQYVISCYDDRLSRDVRHVII